MRAIALLVSLLVLSACVSNKTHLDIMHMNSLASAELNDGGFEGMEHLANKSSENASKRINVFYLHGIGWTENPEEDPLARSFIKGVANAYELQVEGNTLESRCGIRDLEEERSNSFIEIVPLEPIIYQTIIPDVQLTLDKLVCMDRQTLRVDPSLEFVVYRIFWDEIFWEGLQDPHVGQDDNQGYSRGLAGLRRKYNRRLKDEMVNYGFSDAVMYLGPAGAEIRRAVKGAMCSAALDAGGYEFEQQGHKTSPEEACTLASNTNVITNQFAFVSESLGSKIIFDVMRGAMTDGQDTIHDNMIAGSETYMLANQLALLSLSDLSKEPVKPAQNRDGKSRPKIIALSEINDFLSYEINPFFEHLWSLQASNSDGPIPPFDEQARSRLRRTLGFDFVDVRVEFADPIVGLISDFVDPLQAHSDHVAEPEIVQMMLCGAQSGDVTDENCLAANDDEDDDS